MFPINYTSTFYSDFERFRHQFNVGDAVALLACMMYWCTAEIQKHLIQIEQNTRPEN